MDPAYHYRIGAITVIPRAVQRSLPSLVAYDPAGLVAGSTIRTAVLHELDGAETVFPHSGIVVHMARTDAAGVIVPATPEARAEAAAHFAEGGVRPVIRLVSRTGLFELKWSTPNVISPVLLSDYSSSHGLGDRIVADLMFVIGRGWKADPNRTFSNSPCRRAPHLLYQLAFDCEAGHFVLPPHFRYRCHHSMAATLIRAGIIHSRLRRKRPRADIEAPAPAQTDPEADWRAHPSEAALAASIQAAREAISLRALSYPPSPSAADLCLFTDMGGPRSVDTCRWTDGGGLA